MNDHELLELAAKAIGVDVEWRGGDHFGYYGNWNGRPLWEEWNPLTDDGDALRLAVKMRFDMQQDVAEVSVNARRSVDDWIVERLGDDVFASTRRAIVRAAAEIGAAMA